VPAPYAQPSFLSDYLLCQLLWCRETFGVSRDQCLSTQSCQSRPSINQIRDLLLQAATADWKALVCGDVSLSKDFRKLPLESPDGCPSPFFPSLFPSSVDAISSSTSEQVPLYCLMLSLNQIRGMFACTRITAIPVSCWLLK
jgi:hypothetical protein